MVSIILRKLILFSNYFFFFYLVIYSTYLLVCGVYGSVKMYRYRKLERMHNELEHDFYYPISIIVPAYNEGMTAVQTVKNLLKLDYRHYEIVVVDDGSKDDTKQLLIDAFSLVEEKNRPIRYAVPCKPIREIYIGRQKNVAITLISKENGGCKADAANAGINVAAYPYFVNMDADEILQKDALKYAGRAILEDDNVIGVGGNLKISNDVMFSDAMPVSAHFGKNAVVNMQVVEYGRSFISARIFQNLLNTNLIISGGYGVFKKSAVIEIGGYDTKSMGEDMELTIHLHEYHRKNKKPYVMKYVPDSVCWTQAPQNMKDLRRQRERWNCGLIQTINKYKHMILNIRYGWIGMFMLPYMILYELLAPFFVLVGVLVIVGSVALKMLNIPFVVCLNLLYLIFGSVFSTISYLDNIYTRTKLISKKDVVKCFFICVFDVLFFRMYLLCIGFKSYFCSKKAAKKWVSPSRVKVVTTDD